MGNNFMKNIWKDHVGLLKSRLKEKKLKIQVLLGPRQVGKTTFVHFLMSELGQSKFHYHVGDGIHESSWIRLQWQLAVEQNKILVIDEIQKIPDWSEQIKICWDESVRKKQDIKCILLGSSSLVLNKGLGESLTGRFELIPFYHWNYSDSNLYLKFSLDDFLIFGGYPGSYDYIKQTKRWEDYLRSSIVETVIAKDILTQAKVKSPALFRQCFYVLANYPAQVISYNKILGQLQDKGNIDLTKYYIELFEGAFLIKSIHKYTNNEIGKRLSSPKIIALSPSLNTFHRLDNLPKDYLGRVFESVVGAQLIKHFNRVSYWSEGDYEVDYILEHKGQLIAIEVKSGRDKRSVSLEKFSKKYSQAKIIFITKDNYKLFESDPIHFVESKLDL